MRVENNLKMKTFTRKGYGRIYVDTLENIEKVKEIIKEMDQYEYEYLPPDLIALFSEYPNVAYVHKFNDLDINKLTAKCWSLGIKIWVFDAGFEEYPYA